MTTKPRRMLIQAACEALWGERFQAASARALGVHFTTVQRWAKGKSEPGPEISAALYPLVERRIEELQRLSNELRRDMP